MKIRIKGNSLRLRLTQTEVNDFAKGGRVSDSISFGDSQLIYILQSEEREDISADFNGEFITVSVPDEMGNRWAGTEQVGMEAERPLKDGGKLSILIEKDFQCLKPRQGEDESDLFDNPQA